MALTHVTDLIQGDSIHKYNATASAAISETTGAVDRPTRFDSLTLNLSLAPTTSENFTITLDSRNGAAYDTLLYSLDLSAGSVTDLVLDESDIDITLYDGDALVIAWTNTDTRTYGLELTLMEANG